jgi:hypothetical protein
VVLYALLFSSCSVLCHAIMSCACLCCACLCCVVLCCAVLCCAVLCCAVLCCAVLCCAVLCPNPPSSGPSQGETAQIVAQSRQAMAAMQDHCRCSASNKPCGQNWGASCAACFSVHCVVVAAPPVLYHALALDATFRKMFFISNPKRFKSS